MSEHAYFNHLIEQERPVGEVVGVDRFLVKVKGLQPTNVHALILFEDGSKGYVHHVYENYVMVMHLGTDILRIGMLAVVQHTSLVSKVGKNFIGRVVSVLGEPLDGKGPIVPDKAWPVFHNAPMLYERELLDHQLETGVSVLDLNFSLVRGQRMAILGDSKSGKSTLATQVAINQRDTDITVIYVLIAKRHSDVSTLLDRLEKNDALGKSIVIVSTMFESLVMSYIAPYVAAAMGEYFWQELDMDTLVVYDDLTSHAQAYREISLISGVSPGRDSYPGDMFYVHSQLVERAGKLERNHKTQTILPIVYAPSGDITAYLPTNVMSMTDGQWILDMKVFRDTMRPAVQTGLSVTRVGGVGQNKRQKTIAGQIAKAFAAFHTADEFAHFGSEMSDQAKRDLETGKLLFEAMNQVPGETYSLMAQQLVFDIILNRDNGEVLDIKKLKEKSNELAKDVVEDKESSNFDQIRDTVKQQCIIEVKQQEDKKDHGDEPNAGMPSAVAAKEGDASDKKKDDAKPEHNETKTETAEGEKPEATS